MNRYDCIIIDDEEIARDTLKSHIIKVPFLNLIGCYESPLEALALNRQVDIIFSDISMPDMDGISYFRSLKKPSVFIFVTGNPQFAAESYDLDVTDFLVKPFDFPRLLRAAEKARFFLTNHGDSKSDKGFLTVKDRNRNIVLEYEDITYIKSNRDYIEINTLEKNYVLWRTLTSIEQVLPQDQFCRVHKSYIVRLNFVRSITATKITLLGNYGTVPIGNQFRDKVYQYFGID